MLCSFECVESDNRYSIPARSHIVVSEGFTVAVMEEISDGRGERGRQKENKTEVPH